MNNNKQRYLYSVLSVLVIALPLFYQLGYLPIQLWDESRVSLNAVEMLKNGKYFVSYYAGEPDMWNTKPPLLLWFQIASMKVFSINEFAIRLPSAIAALLTTICLILFSKKHLNSWLVGLFAALTLICSQGYVTEHVSRTGDYDALLVLFTTMAALSFYSYTHSKSNKQLLLFFVSVGLAILTKSITGLIFLPAIAGYALITRNIAPLLRNKYFFLGIGICALSITFYFVREQINPGYIQAVMENELGGRFLNTLDSHQHGFFYYFINLLLNQFTPWLLFLPLSSYVWKKSNNKELRNILLYLAILSGFFLLVISISQTKLIWYTAPILPLLSLIVAITLHFIFQQFIQLKRFVNWKKNQLALLFCLIVFLIPYTINMVNLSSGKVAANEAVNHEMISYLKMAFKNQKQFKQTTLMYDGYLPHVAFYTHRFEKDELQMTYFDGNLIRGNIMAFQPNIKQFIETKYIFNVIEVDGNVTTYQVLNRK